MKKFVPYREIGDQDVLIIDGQHKRCVKLSHWGGANTYNDISGDSSAEIVLNAIHKNHHTLNRELVSASHFDIDGFVGVWSYFHPDKAIEAANILKEMAVTGDFREYNPQVRDANQILKLVCWINRMEKENFYPPFGVSNELSSCHHKFLYFLETFEDILDHTGNYQKVWQDEYQKVLADIEIMHKPETRIEKYDDIGLVIVETPEPVHYYAITGMTVGYDTVLSIFSNNRYELEYKYHTWIDMISRPTWPRLKLTSLISELNQIEQNDKNWYMDRLADSGPILRLIDEPVPKVIRYDQPYKREIFSSSIDNDVIKNKVVSYFRESYKNIVPKTTWTSSDLRMINKNLLE